MGGATDFLTLPGSPFSGDIPALPYSGKMMGGLAENVPLLNQVSQSLKVDPQGLVGMFGQQPGAAGKNNNSMAFLSALLASGALNK